MFKGLFIGFALLFATASSMTAGAQDQDDNQKVKDALSELDMVINLLWKYKEGDDPRWADPAFDDSDWDTTNTIMIYDEKGRPELDEIVWCRWHLVTPENLKNKIVGFIVTQGGASDIYLDGELIHSFGEPSNKIGSEEVHNPGGIPFPAYFDDRDTHVVAVRYSNLHAEKNFKKHGIDFAGFTIAIGDYNDALSNYIVQTKGRIIFLIFLGAVFLTLGGIHLVIYLFYRKKRNNLFYSIFTLSSAAFCLVTEWALESNNPVVSAQLFNSFAYVVPVFLMAFLSILYSLFYEKTPKIFWIMLGVMVLIIILQILDVTGVRVVVAGVFSLAVYVEAFRVSLMGIIRRKRGAWIVASGVMFLLLTILSLIILGVIGGDNSIRINQDDGTTGIIIAVVMFLAIMSLPISMSIYLAWDISGTNRELSSQLMEVQRLSEETIRQEQEKKKILETQKEQLETQVAERTHEIRQQKDLVEEKNKEILDSINYAKRIQEAILPPKKLVQSWLPNSFVLYKSKDIVAGDFYWMQTAGIGTAGAGGGNELVIFAAADCTGHGVPGAMVSVVCHNALNRAVREFRLLEPAAILDKARELVLEQFEKSEEEVKDGMDIALCILNPTTRELQYAGANNPLWLLRNGQTEIEEVRADKQPIGKFSKESPFTNHVIQLEEGDTIYIFSDGYPDQFGGERGKKYKSGKLKRFFASLQADDMDAQREKLNREFENWRGDLEQIDDVCVIGVRV